MAHSIVPHPYFKTFLKSKLSYTNSYNTNSIQANFPFYKRTNCRINKVVQNAKQSLQVQEIKYEEVQEQEYYYGRVVWPTALSLLLCNMDRICLSVAILPMALQFGWTETTQGLIQSSFLWGYIGTQLIAGVLADKYGGKAVLTFGIIWFSLSTMLLPLATAMLPTMTLAAVLFARFLVGLGEGVVMPSMPNLVSTFVRPELRASALGNIITGFHSGNIAGLVASPFVIERFGWQAIFYMFGVLGLPVLLIWRSMVPDRQQGQILRGKSPEGKIEKASMIEIPRMLRSAPCWAIFVQHFVHNWGYFILLGWMPTYFSKQLGFSLRDSSLLSLLPWLVMAIGSSIMGSFADKLLQMGLSLRNVRIGIQCANVFGAALCFLMMSSENIGKSTAIALLMIILGFKSLGSSGFLANMSDIAPKNSGQVFGMSNTFGSLAGIVGLSFVGWLVEKTGSFKAVFLVTGAMYILAGMVWVTLSKTEQVFL
eukprot:TRINITY_DN4246_c0_g2_i1.p1 TRINITY_DN4246_c0_g2~~TRINITY_DN4246_c0_g2_i1.p1  ORF type:complete len:503 (-),score=43.12 TRINITY_DN4246_c0_g2_i1:171-1616(-)